MTRPYKPMPYRRRQEVQKRTGIHPRDQLDWCLRNVDVCRLTHRQRDQVLQWVRHGRRRYSELSFHKLAHMDYSIGAEYTPRWATRMQDLLIWCVDWKLDLWIVTEQDKLMLQRGRNAVMLSKGYDPLQFITIHYTEESE